MPRGLLTITAPVDVGQTLLPRIIHAYLVKYPEVNIKLVISNNVTDLVGEGIDLAIRAGPIKDSSLIGRRFFELTANIYASPRYLDQLGTPRHPRELSKFDFVAYGEMKTIDICKGKTTVTVPIRERVRADDFQTIRALIAMGVGIGWLPDFLARDGIERGLLVPVLASWKASNSGTVQFIYSGRRHSSTTVRAFIELALAEVTSPPRDAY